MPSPTLFLGTLIKMLIGYGRLDSLETLLGSTNTSLTQLGSDLDIFVNSLLPNLNEGQRDVFETSLGSMKDLLSGKQSELNSNFILFKNRTNSLRTRITADRNLISNFRIGGISGPLSFSNIENVYRIVGNIDVSSSPTLTDGNTELGSTTQDIISTGVDGLGNDLSDIFNLNDGFVDVETRFRGGSQETKTQNEEEGLSSLIGQGRLIDAGNYVVDSVIANVSGFFSWVAGAVSDLFQAGQGNLSGNRNAEVSGLGSDLAIANHISWSGKQGEVDPLVLDLDGDGIELKTFAENRIFFDIDNDNNKERTGWVGADDGILVHDRNGNGTIDDITETISEYYGAAAGTGAIYTDGFAALRTLDSNDDGTINSSDTAFANLRVWKDENSDGITDVTEDKSKIEIVLDSFKYYPDFILKIDDGKGADDPLYLVVEIKGYDRGDAKAKANAMRGFWVPGINQSGKFGRWGFAEFTDVWQFEKHFNQCIEKTIKNG